MANITEEYKEYKHEPCFVAGRFFLFERKMFYLYTVHTHIRLGQYLMIHFRSVKTFTFYEMNKPFNEMEKYNFIYFYGVNFKRFVSDANLKRMFSLNNITIFPCALQPLRVYVLMKDRIFVLFSNQESRYTLLTTAIQPSTLSRQFFFNRNRVVFAINNVEFLNENS